jgi:hypothetical protein
MASKIFAIPVLGRKKKISILVLRGLQIFPPPGAPTLLGPAMILAIFEVTSFLCDVPVIPLPLLTLFFLLFTCLFFFIPSGETSLVPMILQYVK